MSKVEKKVNSIYSDTALGRLLVRLHKADINLAKRKAKQEVFDDLEKKYPNLSGLSVGWEELKKKHLGDEKQ